jgi:hypothetical protein
MSVCLSVVSVKLLGTQDDIRHYRLAVTHNMSLPCLSDVLRGNQVTYVAALMEMGLSRDEAFQRLETKKRSFSLQSILTAAERRFQHLVRITVLFRSFTVYLYIVSPELFLGLKIAVQNVCSGN